MKELLKKLREAETRAAAKLAELKDDTSEEMARSIETDHQAIMNEIAQIRAAMDKLADEDDGEARNEPAQAGAGNGNGTSAADILNIGTRAGMDAAAIEAAIRSSTSVDAFRTQAFEHLAGQSDRTRTAPGRVVRDENETRRNALTEALSYRMGAPLPNNGPSEPARPFMEMRRFSSFIAEAIGHRGRIDSVRALDDLMDRAANSTSDFPAIYEGAVNRSLEGRYALAQPTYRRIALRSDFHDFRPHKTVKIGDYPMLKRVAQDGEIKYGSFGEGAEVTQAFAYARAIAITREMIVNDDLGAIARLLASYGDTVALFEEVVFYSEAFNAKLSDGKTVFHADHKNTGAGAAISVDEVAKGRAAMSKQKSIDDQPLLNNAPKIILCGPDTITDAEKLVASITPATMATVNIFSGRLEPLETPQIGSKSWNLLPDAASGRSNYRYGLLDGYEAPRVRMEEPFGRQGFAMSVEHDFGVGATDFRFGYQNPGQ
ncbi:MAG: hypothetical protein LCH86_07665 [Proteobacteria bacterium]|nr:hypothetical protein [Pseudomonadota bacterium]